MFPIKEDIQIFNFQELDVNVKERVDYREMGMMRPERVGGWGGGGDLFQIILQIRYTCLWGEGKGDHSRQQLLFKEM